MRFVPPPMPTRPKLVPPLTELFGNAEDGTPLYWQAYVPTGAGPWPAALIIHGGGFKSEEQAPKLLDTTARDMVAAGYIAFANHYRLSPPGKLAGQTTTGCYPQQHHDIALAIQTARADSRVTDKVVAVGGSAGGTHVAYACNVGTIGDDRLDAGVALSGAYRYNDRTPDKNLAAFTNTVEGYVGSTSLTTQLSDSPVTFVVSNMKPCYFAYGNDDTMPLTQTPDIQEVILSAGITNCTFIEVTGRHAFAIWPLVKTAAIAFVNAAIA